MRTKIDLSRSVNLSPALSRRWIWSSILRTAKSRRGLSGPGGRTASFSLDCIGVDSSLSPHFLANLSDKLFPPKTVVRRVKAYYYIVNMYRVFGHICGCIWFGGFCCVCYVYLCKRFGSVCGS